MSDQAIIERAKIVAYGLMGTTSNIQNVATEKELNDSVFCSILDDIVFECTECGWWCSTDERSSVDDFICDQCG
mgnify:CR=1 FL=1